MVGTTSTSVYPPSASTPTGSSNPTASGRDQQVEKLLKEVKHLKQKVDLLDKENSALKKSIYDLSARYAASISQGGLTYRPFVVDHGSTSNMDSKAEQVISMAVQEAAGNDFQPSNVLICVMMSFEDALTSVSFGIDYNGEAFDMRYELKGHVGAVYTVEFSPNGSLLASGSFDKTVRIWDTVSAQKEVMCLKGHTLNISDVAWTSESNKLVSGAYDETCKTWDVETSKLSGTFEMDGFVQCVGWDFMGNSIIIFLY